MNLTELERRLQDHAINVKSHMAPPLEIERKDFEAMKSNRKITTALVLAAAVICILGTTVFAANYYLSARQAAQVLGYSKLAAHLKDNASATQPITDGKYKAAVLGVTSGADISDFTDSDEPISPERTYAVVAIEKTDGSNMTYDDEVLVTPLIEGLTPWQYNIFTMNGASASQVIDGTLYRIIEFDNIELFADRQVYIGVIDNAFLNNSQFSFDESTGKISEKADYAGTNILFELKLDPAKANPQKAEEYLQRLQQEWESGGDDDEDAGAEIDDADSEHVSVTFNETIAESEDGEIEFKVENEEALADGGKIEMRAGDKVFVAGKDE